MTVEIFEIVKRLLDDEALKIKDIAKMVDLCPKTVSRIKKSLGISGFKAFNEKYRETIYQKSSILDSKCLIIKNMVACNNDITLEEVRDEVYEKSGGFLSLSTVSRKIKNLGITRKNLSLVPEERNSSEKINLRAVYALEVSTYSISNLVFLDEPGFNLHTSRTYGYSPKNTKAYTFVPANKGRNLSCLCVISYDGLVAYETRRAAYNSAKFIEFIEKFWSNTLEIIH